MTGREVITLKLLPPNAGKRRWLEGIQQAYARALRDGLEALRSAGTVDRSRARQSAYRIARRCGLPGAIARAAADETLSMVHKAERPNGFRVGPQGYQVRSTEKGWALRLSTGEGQDFRWFPLHVPEKFQERLARAGGDARLFQCKGAWYVRLPVHRSWKPAPVLRLGVEHSFIGIDLGVVRLVTLAAPGRVFIFRGLALRRRRQQVAERCRKYAAQGRHSLAGKLHAKEQRWMTAVNHQVSRKIIHLAERYTSPVLVLERLPGLRRASQATSRTNSLQRAWDFRQLVEFIAYKAQEAGVAVIFVDPRGTSTSCPKCRYNAPENNPAPGQFRCTQCDYQANVDVVAAYNIAHRGQETFPYSYLKKLSPG